MYETKHTLILGGQTIAPGTTLTAEQLEGCDIDRLIELEAIAEGAIDAAADADPYAGMTKKQREAAEKAAAKAAADDGLGG